MKKRISKSKFIRLAISMLLCLIVFFSTALTVFAFPEGRFCFIASGGQLLNVWTPGAVSAGNYIRLHPATGDTSQRWEIRKQSGGYHSLRVVANTSLAINKLTNSTHAILWNYVGGEYDSLLFMQYTSNYSHYGFCLKNYNYNMLTPAGESYSSYVHFLNGAYNWRRSG